MSKAGHRLGVADVFGHRGVVAYGVVVPPRWPRRVGAAELVDQASSRRSCGRRPASPRSAATEAWAKTAQLAIRSGRRVEEEVTQKG